MTILAGLIRLITKGPILFVVVVLGGYLLITHVASKAVLSNVLAAVFVLLLLYGLTRATRAGRNTRF